MEETVRARDSASAPFPGIWDGGGALRLYIVPTLSGRRCWSGGLLLFLFVVLVGAGLVEEGVFCFVSAIVGPARWSELGRHGLVRRHGLWILTAVVVDVWRAGDGDGWSLAAHSVTAWGDGDPSVPGGEDGGGEVPDVPALFERAPWPADAPAGEMIPCVKARRVGDEGVIFFALGGVEQLHILPSPHSRGLGR